MSAVAGGGERTSARAELAASLIILACRKTEVGSRLETVLRVNMKPRTATRAFARPLRLRAQALRCKFDEIRVHRALLVRFAADIGLASARAGPSTPS